MFERYSASAQGRTWKTIAFSFSSTARSSRRIASFFCASAVIPGSGGQVELLTDATHPPRNSRGRGGGSFEDCATETEDSDSRRTRRASARMVTFWSLLPPGEG